jgi:hypothetical protein
MDPGRAGTFHVGGVDRTDRVVSARIADAPAGANGVTLIVVYTLEEFHKH